MKKSSALSVLRHPRAFARFLGDREAPLLPRLFALFAVLYVVLPIDAIPDAIPVIGWLDDVGVIALVLAWTSRTVAKYRTGGADRGDPHAVVVRR
ncbi:MAG: DUF1232 domain-containing protein [Deltaproteobacteria bacterium]|nr:DUF1232 domain-containing protein [Deltaproteobacteria bacterium]